jgi:hypothetical protein
MATVKQTPMPKSMPGKPTLERKSSSDSDEEGLPPEILDAQQRIGLVRPVKHKVTPRSALERASKPEPATMLSP